MPPPSLDSISPTLQPLTQLHHADHYDVEELDEALHNRYRASTAMFDAEELMELEDQVFNIVKPKRRSRRQSRRRSQLSTTGSNNRLSFPIPEEDEADMYGCYGDDEPDTSTMHDVDMDGCEQTPQGIRRIATKRQSVGPPPLAIVDEAGNVYALQQPLFPSGHNNTASTNTATTTATAAANPPLMQLKNEQLLESEFLPPAQARLHHGGITPVRRASSVLVRGAPRLSDGYTGHSGVGYTPPVNNLIKSSIYERAQQLQRKHTSLGGAVRPDGSNMVVVEQEIEGWRDEMGVPPVASHHPHPYPSDASHTGLRRVPSLVINDGDSGVNDNGYHPRKSRR